MKKFFTYLILLATCSCTNTHKAEPDKNTNTSKTKIPQYLENDLPFIRNADSICRTIDVESIFERRRDATITDRDGQEYPSQYKGYAKSSSDSVDKFLVNVLFGGKNSAKSTFYYYNGTVVKAITEIFADDTVNAAFYYDGDRLIYPQEAGMEEAAEKTRKESVPFRTFFLPNK